MRFRPEQHLRRPGEIRAVREQGRRVECRAFTIWWKSRERTAALTIAPASPAIETKPTRPTNGARVCVIASRAAVGAAVRRNRAKRRLRDVFRRQQQLVPAGCDLLLIARAAAASCPMPELEQKFADACRQIGSAPQP
jgi:ribonuclease P protein component